MNSKKLFNVILSFLILTILAGSIASAVPLYITEAKVDGTELLPWDITRLDIERDDTFKIKLELFAYEDGQDIEIEAFISGYEYNDHNRISDSTHVFDVEADTIYRKTLELSLPDNVEQDDYRIRIIISDRNGYAEIEEYVIKVDTERHKLKVADVVFSSGKKIEAGHAVLASVRVENQGNKDEDDVKVTLGIPDLGLYATDYINEIEAEEQVESEELYLRIPGTVAPGIYQVIVKVEYDDGHEEIAVSTGIEVLENSFAAAKEDEEGSAETEVIFQQTELSPQEFALVMESQEPVTEDRVSADAESKIKNVLELILVLLIVLLAIVGLIVGFTSLKR